MNDKTPAAGAAPQENKMGVQPIGRLLASMAIAKWWTQRHVYGGV